MKAHFLLNPEITFLNFGSFGATPKQVFEEYLRFQRELEAEPVQFIVNRGPEYLKTSRAALAGYIGCASEDLVFVPNPTHAVNLVAKNLDLKPGDEVLATSIEYGACDRTWNYYCEKSGAHYVRADIRLPMTSVSQFCEDFWRACSEKTKLVFLSQITSATALILPVREICEEAKRRGIPVFIDGAHVPGHIPLDLGTLGADYYTGACHKWMMTPKGSSFLYVRKELQDALDPLIISWGYKADFPSDSQFYDYHQFNGTRDFSAYLTIPKALEFRKEHNWEEVIGKSRKQVQDWLPRLCELVGSEPLAPVNDTFLGQMGSIPVDCKEPSRLKEGLYNDFGIEIPVMIQNEQVFVRFSLNGFNTEEDMRQLEHALKHYLKAGVIKQGKHV